VRDSDDSGASSSVPHTAPAPSHPHGTAAHWLQTLASAATAATNLSGKGSEMSLASAATNLSRKDEEGDACASAAKNLSRKGSESSLGSALADDKGADDKDDVATSTVSELKTTHDKACISQEYATEWHKSRDTATSHVTHSISQESATEWHYSGYSRVLTFENLLQELSTNQASASSVEPATIDTEQTGHDFGKGKALSILVQSPDAVSKPVVELPSSPLVPRSSTREKRSSSREKVLPLPVENKRGGSGEGLSGPESGVTQDGSSGHDASHSALQPDAPSVNRDHHSLATMNGGATCVAYCKDENTIVRGRLVDYVKKMCSTEGTLSGLEHAAAREFQGEERDGAPSVEGQDDDAEQRVRNLARIVHFQEWEAMCMRQDIKVALNTSLWNSITGPSLHALGEHVRARGKANQASLAWRRSFHNIQSCFAAWRSDMLACRLGRRSQAGAERMRARLDRSLRCAVFWDWAAACAPRVQHNQAPQLPSKPPPQPPSWPLKQPPSLSSRPACEVNVSTSPGKSGCFAGLFRCLGGAGCEKAKGCDTPDMASDCHRQTAAV